MTVSQLSQLILYFSIYSFLGWVCETIYCSLLQRKLVKRGFLEGPYCPIYGFGALAILYTTIPLMHSPALVFLSAMLCAGLLEYFTAWLLESLFHMKWWDYSGYRFQIKGRVCLLNLLMFGVMGLCLTYLIHPDAARLIVRIPSWLQQILSAALILTFSLDLTHAVLKLSGLKQRLESLHALVQELEAHNARYDWYDKKDIPGSLQRLREYNERDQCGPLAVEMLERLDELAGRRDKIARMLNAYPQIRSQRRNAELRSLKEHWNSRLHRLRNIKKPK